MKTLRLFLVCFAISAVPFLSTAGEQSRAIVVRPGSRIQAVNYYPFHDDMENPASGNWVADVPWGLTTIDAHSPIRSWTDSPSGFYQNDADVSLASSFTVDLSAAVHPALQFRHHYDLEPGFDFGLVEVSTDGGMNWTEVARFSGTEADPATVDLRGSPKPDKPEEDAMPKSPSSVGHEWIVEQIDLSGYAGTSSFQFRFRLSSDGSVTRDGWYIDDVALAEVPASVTLNPIANPTSSSLELSWSMSTDPAFLRYEIYRSQADSAGFNDDLVAVISDSTMTGYVDTGLAAKQTYYYRVYVVSDDGIYGASNAQSGMTQSGLDYPFMDDMEGGAKWYASVPNTWRLVTPDQAHSGNKIWTDSPGGDYGNDWDTAMELGGTLPLTNASTLVFWQRLHILAGDTAFVEVSTDNGATWAARESFSDTSISEWTRVQVDLSDVQADAMIRFRLKTDSSGTAEGWDIDDVSVSDAPPALTVTDPVQSVQYGRLMPSWTPSTSVFFKEYRLYRATAPSVDSSSTLLYTTSLPLDTSFVDSTVVAGQTYYYRVYEVTSYDVYVGSSVASGTASDIGFPFYDDMETSDGIWIADSPWARTTEQSHSGSMSWSDSPGVPYASDADVSLKINLSLDQALDPYLSFWERHSLGSSSHGYVEVSTDGINWTVAADLMGYNPDWQEIRIDLSDYHLATDFWVRFRLYGGGTSGDGWHIDDVSIQENTSPDLAYPFYDGMEDSGVSSSQWIASTWKIASPGYFGNGTWNGAVRGDDKNYNWISPNGYIDLTSAVSPRLVFWHKSGNWYAGSAFVKVKAEGGDWTTIWSASPPSSWSRVELDLSAYVGSRLRILFLLKKNWGAWDECSWYVDEISVGEAPADVVMDPPSPVGKHEMTLSWSTSSDSAFLRYELRRLTSSGVSLSSPIIATIPSIDSTSYTDTSLELNKTYYYKVFVVKRQGTVGEDISKGSNEVSATTLQAPYPLIEDMEGTLDDWDLDSPWGVTNATAHGGTFSLTDSPGGYYASDANVTFWTSLSLDSVAHPYLSFWEKHDFGPNTHAFIECSKDGTVWTAMVELTGSDPVWKEVRLDLSDFRFQGNFWLRFRLDANGSTGDGWYIDDISVQENPLPEVAYPFYEGLEDSAAAFQNWLAGSWEVTNEAYRGSRAWKVAVVYTSSGIHGARPNVLEGAVDLTNAASPRLVFWHRQSPIWGSQVAGVYIQPIGDQWNTLWSGSPPSDWSRVEVDLSQYAGSRVRIMFKTYDNNLNPNGDWYVDEIHIAESPADVVLNSPTAIGKHAMTLSWSPSTDTTFVRYELRRSTSPGVTYSDHLAASISSVDSTSFTDSTLSLSTKYYYRVFVVRHEGAEELTSAGSNEVSGTTLQGPAYPVVENMEGSLDDWDLESPWGITTDYSHGGSQSLTDSPGAPYATDANSSFGTALSLGLAQHPYLSFWERHVFGANSHAFVEASTDGSTWITLCDLTGYNPSWREVRVDLSDYRYETSFFIRFRFYAGGSTGEGWYVDDVAIQENPFPDMAYPFYEGCEDSLAAVSNWLASSWELSGPGYLGNGAWQAKMYSNSGNSRENKLCLAGPIDLTSATSPKLVFWHYRGSWYGSSARVEVQPVGGSWATLWSGTPPASWTRVESDLSAYVGEKIRIRFSISGGGYSEWFVDEISVAEPGQVPGMTATPAVLYFDVHPDSSRSATLTIENTGSNTLTYAIQEALGGQAGSPASLNGTRNWGTRERTTESSGIFSDALPRGTAQTDVSWLSISPATGSIPAGQSADVTVTCDGSIGPGNYVAYIVISGNDPVGDLVVVPVQLNVSGVYLLAPSPGDSIAVGRYYEIAWSSVESLSSVDIFLSADGGNRFDQTIVSGYMGPSPYPWSVSGTLSDSCVIEIRCVTMNSDTIYDLSNGFFTIYQDTSATSVHDLKPAPDRVFLGQNYPNPFNPSTTIHYMIKEPGHVTLKVYAVDGHLVRTLVDENQVPTSDGYTVQWNGRDNLGQTVSSGVYFCVLDANGLVKTRKMVLLK